MREPVINLLKPSPRFPKSSSVGVWQPGTGYPPNRITSPQRRAPMRSQPAASTTRLEVD